MTDRELLELAAKAAKIFVTKEQFEKDCTSPWDKSWEILEYDEDSNSISGWETIYSFSGELSGWGIRNWAPLTDDGDALRLAVTVDISFWQARGAAVADHDRLGPKMREPYGSDKYAAARRAIVRAAAELGMDMP